MPNETEHDAEVEASVGPADVELFDNSNHSMVVKEDEVDYWLSRGFRKNKFDIGESATRLVAYLHAAEDAVQVFVRTVLSDGVIDTADASAAATLNGAMSLIGAAWDQLNSDIGRAFPVAQGVPVKMKDADGAEFDVDPGQVEEYKAKGCVEA